VYLHIFTVFFTLDLRVQSYKTNKRIYKHCYYVQWLSSVHLTWPLPISTCGYQWDRLYFWYGYDFIQTSNYQWSLVFSTFM